MVKARKSGKPNVAKPSDAAQAVVVRMGQRVGLDLPGPTRDGKLAMGCVNKLARLPADDLRMALQRVAKAPSWARWLQAASAPKNPPPPPPKKPRSPSRGGARSAPTPPVVRQRRAGAAGKVGDYCHTHNLVRTTCPLCRGEWKVVYMSGGGTRYHLLRDCPGLIRGQALVDDRGGMREPVTSVTRTSLRLMSRGPCTTCIPLALRRPPVVRPSKSPLAVKVDRPLSKVMPPPRRETGAHAHRWAAWRTDGDGLVRRSCYDCESKELRMTFTKPPKNARQPDVAKPVKPSPTRTAPSPSVQRRVVRNVTFGDASRQVIGLVVGRPTGVPRKNWSPIGVIELACTECETTMGVIEHPATSTVALICSRCKTGWPLSLYDDTTARQVRKFIGQAASATNSAKRGRVTSKRQSGGSTRQVESRDDDDDDDIPRFGGPARLPDGDGPRSRPRGGWTARW